MAKILIVDDQQCIRGLIAAELADEGYQVATAGGAESVKAYLRFSPPDLVILDLYLDGDNGWEMLRDVKSEHPHLPVVIFTAHDSFAEDPRLSEADGYVIKSTDFRPLKQNISKALSRQGGAERRVEPNEYLSSVSLA